MLGFYARQSNYLNQTGRNKLTAKQLRRMKQKSWFCSDLNDELSSVFDDGWMNELTGALFNSLDKN